MSQTAQEIRRFGRAPQRLANGYYAEIYSWVPTPRMPRGWLSPVLLAEVKTERMRKGLPPLHWTIVHCPYCGRKHTHGGSTEPPIKLAGFRYPHCGHELPWMLDNRASYVVAVRDPGTGVVVTVAAPEGLYFVPSIVDNPDTPPPAPDSWPRRDE